MAEHIVTVPIPIPLSMQRRGPWNRSAFRLRRSVAIDLAREGNRP